MLELFANELAAVDRRLAEDPRLELSAAMRRIPLEVFGELCLAEPENLNAIRSRLPTMASDEVQRNWTGNCGQALMNQSVAFVRTMLSMHGAQGGKETAALRILDFGCGWGRLLRLLLNYIHSRRQAPWRRSLAPPRAERGSRRHREAPRSGFAFLPHANREPIQGEITYGDTSMSLDQRHARRGLDDRRGRMEPVRPAAGRGLARPLVSVA